MKHFTRCLASLLAVASLSQTAVAADDSVGAGRRRVTDSVNIKSLVQTPSTVDGGVTAASYVGVAEGLRTFLNSSAYALQISTQATGGCVDLTLQVGGQPAGRASNDCDGSTATYTYLVPPGAAFTISGVAQGNDLKSYVMAFASGGVTLQSLGWNVTARGTEWGYVTSAGPCSGVVARTWLRYADGQLSYLYGSLGISPSSLTWSASDPSASCGPIEPSGA